VCGASAIAGALIMTLLLPIEALLSSSLPAPA
jgi:hypothetical protein